MTFAKSGGGSMDGGGDDASEAQVNQTRADILEWIQDGRYKKLEFPEDINANAYNAKMKDILVLKKVVIGFVENNDSPDEELRVAVDNVPKTCRGFISQKDSRPHILCSIPRFPQIPQFRPLVDSTLLTSGASTSGLFF